MLHNRFEILRRVQLGPVTETVEANDKSTGEHVFLCTLHQHLVGRNEVARRFRDQVTLAQRRNHHRLLPILAVAPEHGAWFTMPSLPGRFLTELPGETNAGQVFTSARTTPVMIGQLLELLVYLETAAGMTSRGRLHPVAYRGLAPSRVHWGYDDQIRVVPVTAPAGAPDDLTAVGLVDDAADYLAPDADDPVAADRYALAALTFELVTGRRWRDVRAKATYAVDMEDVEPETALWILSGLATVEDGGFGSAVEMAGAWARIHRASK